MPCFFPWDSPISSLLCSSSLHHISTLLQQPVRWQPKKKLSLGNLRSSSKELPFGDNEDANIAVAVCNGTIASYSLESSLGDCKRAASVRRTALDLMTGRSLDGLPLEGFNYQSILGQCCEMPLGYVKVPVGVAGPLLVNGSEYMVPMATTEGCVVASTNIGCKAIFMSGGATSIPLRDGMTRAPVVRFQSAKRVADKFYIEDPTNSDNLSDIII
ncbi:hypothetical protein SUGI_1171370 [Cryptomeria japonica]|nr:hypothetical protein SUGI_1171370 [Cryptomeria japonica]